MVGKGVIVGTGVGLGGIDVDVDVAEGMGVATLGGADVAQAVNRMSKRIQMPFRNINPLSIHFM